MLLDCSTDHLALDEQWVDVPPGIIETKECLASGIAKLHELVAFLNPDLAHAAIRIDRALRSLLEVVAILHDDFTPTHPGGSLDSDLDARGDLTASARDGHEADVRLV